MSLPRLLGGVLLATLMPTGAYADDNSAETIKARFAQLHPQLHIRSIQDTPIPGLYEVFANGQILYVDSAARYVLAGGQIMEIGSKHNLTAERMKELTRVRFDTLPFKDAIEIKKGSGAYHFAVFSDPDCPFCKTLETGLEKLGLTDYTAHIFLFPLQSIHPDARWKAESIWCATDRNAAWKAWMLEGKLPEKKSCDTPVDRITKLADELNVGGTPTIYLESGHATNAPEELVAAIKQKQKAAK